MSSDSSVHSMSLERALMSWEGESQYGFDLTSDALSDINVNVKSMKSMDNSSNGEKVSDAIIYGPRFCDIFEEFNKSMTKPIDPSRHLMALCTEYLIAFCQWSRASPERITWIREKLLDHEYLRCEVRNGMVMVIIYTFASIKASIIEGADMFTTLQDHERGKIISPNTKRLATVTVERF